MGRIFALLIGENKYSATGNDGNDLSMAVPDAKVTAPRILARHGADPANTHTLIDAANTRENQLAEMNWLVDRREPGDVLYFHDSSHGTHGMRHGRLEQALCCFGCVDPGRFNDCLVFQADMQERFSRAPEGVKIFVAIDACMNGLRALLPGYHPGARIRYLPTPQDVAEACPPLMYAGSGGASHGAADLHRGFLSWLGRRKKRANEFEVADQPGADPVWMSGCTRDGTCADCPDLGGGAFTIAEDHADAACVQAAGGPHVKMRDLFDAYTAWLINAAFDQKPEVWSTAAGLGGGFLE